MENIIMSNSSKTIKVSYKVEPNEVFGDFRIDEYFNGEWNNQKDDGYSESRANSIVRNLESYLIKVNGSLVVPANCVTTL